MKVSIIVPCFNGEKFLREALDSALCQTYRDIEVIIVDDGSTDKSPQIASQYVKLNERISYLRKENGGLSSARNLGVKKAQGEIVAFLDADDWWHPEKAEAHINHLMSSPDIGVSYSDVQFVTESGAIMRHVRNPKKRNLSDYYLYCRNPITNGSNGFFRKIIFEEHQFDETLRRSQDVDCWNRIAFSGKRVWKFEGIPGLLTFYRVNTGGLSNSYRDHYDCAKRVWEKSFEYAPDVARKYAGLAEGFQLRFYARRAVSDGNFSEARKLILSALSKDMRILWYEGISSIAVLVISHLPKSIAARLLNYIENK